VCLLRGTDWAFKLFYHFYRFIIVCISWNNKNCFWHYWCTVQTWRLYLYYSNCCFCYVSLHLLLMCGYGTNEVRVVKYLFRNLPSSILTMVQDLSGSKDKDIWYLHLFKKVYFSWYYFPIGCPIARAIGFRQNTALFRKKNVINNLRRLITNSIRCFNTNIKPAFRPHSLLCVYCDSYRSIHSFPNSV
jgi:hypothetical protein